MSEERLREIKKCIDLQKEYPILHDDGQLIAQKEELYNEVIRLRKKLATKKLFKKYKVQTPENFEIRKIFELQQRIDTAVEYIEEHEYDIRYNFDCYVKGNDLLNILKGEK